MAAVTSRGLRFVAAVDQAAPGRLTGVYLVGSAALGDWQERLSNIDVVVVADGWDDQAIGVVSRASPALGEDGRPSRIGFVTFDDLKGQATAPGPVCVMGGKRVAADELANPLTWKILAEDGVCLRGPEYFPVRVDDGELRRWAAERLTGVWAPWADRAGRMPGQLWRRRALAMNLLEVTRLHIAATRGQVVSKVRAGQLVGQEVAGHFDRVVTDAVGYRRGSNTSMYWGPVERKHHTLELIADLTSRASAQTP